MGEDMAQVSQRLDRFERSLDEIRAAMIQMAKTEERVSIILGQTTDLFKMSTEMQNRIAKIERENATQAQSIGLFERFGWIVAALAAGALGWFKGPDL
jgi:methyl-accepting chemotaxis protein